MGRSNTILGLYRFPQAFIRKTKHAYITVIDDYMLGLLENAKPVSYDKLRSYFRRRPRSKCGFHLFRNIWATYMHCQRIDTGIIDLLQGRIPKTIFSRYYYRPDLKPLLDKVRAEVPSLLKLIKLPYLHVFDGVCSFKRVYVGKMFKTRTIINTKESNKK